MPKKHANLSVFVPHAGCPQRCIFCDQRAISGVFSPPDAAKVSALCDKFLPPPGAGSDTEIAFFGGSFTAVERGYMTELLSAAHPFVKAGRAAGIRISTRPDAVDETVLVLLKRYGVTSVELGAESTDDAVLAKNLRGHTFEDLRSAVSLIRQGGFSLGLQMMVGMYGERDPESAAMKTAADFIRLAADTVRIYPVLVLRHTRLEELYRDGAYIPLKPDEAARITGRLLLRFWQSGIRVIRTGLHDDELLRESVAAGPYHPAFGELAQNRAFRELFEKRLQTLPKGGYTAVVAKGRLSAAIGQNRDNAGHFEAAGYRLKWAEDETFGQFEIDVRPGTV